MFFAHDQQHTYAYTSADSFREDMASMIDGETDEIDFDWDQAQKELLNGAGIDMAKEMECKLLTVAEEVNDLHCFKPSRLLPLLSLSLLTQKF